MTDITQIINNAYTGLALVIIAASLAWYVFGKKPIRPKK